MSSRSRTDHKQASIEYIVRREFYMEGDDTAIRTTRVETPDFEEAARLYFEGPPRNDLTVEAMLVVKRNGKMRPLNVAEKLELKRLKPEGKVKTA